MMAANQDLRAVEDAQKRLSEMLDLASDTVDILDVLALTKLRLGKPEEAAEELERSLAKVPAHLQSSVDLAKLKLTQKDLAGAQQVLQNAVKAAPQSVDAALALGRFYLFSGKPEQAQAEVRCALQDSPAAQDTLGWAYYCKGNYEGAIRYLKTALEKDGTPRLKYHLGMAYLKAGKQDLGQRMMKAALGTDPTLATSQGR